MIKFIKKIYNYFKGYKGGGLYDEVDDRNFGAETVFGSAERSGLTDKDFSVGNFTLINQGSTDFCVGCGKSYFKQLTEHLLMSWAGAYSMGCRSLGYIPKFGISILQVMKGAVKFGVPEEKFWKYKEWNGTKASGRNYFANWHNMSQEVLDNALKHKDESFFQISNQYGWDKFDLFRFYLHKFYKEDKKIVIQTGTDGHNVTLISQKTVAGELKLVGIDSYGKRSMNYRIGRSVNGFRYFNRSEANQLFTGYIAFDIPRSLAEILVKYNGKVVKTEDSPDCFLIKGGVKHSLIDEDIANSNGYLLAPDENDKLTEIIEEEDMELIPTGEPLKFEGGINEFIVRRIYERNKLALKY